MKDAHNKAAEHHESARGVPYPRLNGKLESARTGDSHDLARFSEAGDGHGLTTAQILYRRPDLAAANLCLAGLRSLPGISRATGLSGILAEIARRCPAFGHGRTFSSYQTGQDPTGGRAVPAASISDRLHSPLRGSRRLHFPGVSTPGKSSLCNQAPQGKGRHMKSSGPSTSHVFSRRVR